MGEPPLSPKPALPAAPGLRSAAASDACCWLPPVLLSSRPPTCVSSGSSPTGLRDCRAAAAVRCSRIPSSARTGAASGAGNCAGSRPCACGGVGASGDDGAASAVRASGFACDGVGADEGAAFEGRGGSGLLRRGGSLPVGTCSSLRAGPRAGSIADDERPCCAATCNGDVGGWRSWSALVPAAPLLVVDTVTALGCGVAAASALVPPEVDE